MSRSDQPLSRDSEPPMPFTGDGTPVCKPSMWRRVVCLHGLLTQGRRVNSTALFERMRMPRRTFARTIEFMQDDLGMDLEYKEDRKSWIFHGTLRPLLPLVWLTATEAVMLTIFYQAFAAWAGAPSRILGSVLRKFAAVVGGHVSFSVDSVADVSSPADILAASEWRHIGTLHQAVRRRQELRVVYQGVNDAQPRRRTIHPLHLRYAGRRWILLLWDMESADYRTFALSRLHEVKRTGRKFKPPAGFDAAEILRGNLGAYTGREDHEICLLLRDAAARDALDHAWHSSQQIIRREDKAIEITLRLNNLVDIVNAVLQWGPQAEVISPPALRTKVRDALKAALAIYADKGDGDGGRG